MCEKPAVMLNGAEICGSTSLWMSSTPVETTWKTKASLSRTMCEKLPVVLNGAEICGSIRLWMGSTPVETTWKMFWGSTLYVLSA